MRNRTAINAAAAVTTLAAWCGLYVFLHPRPPQLDRRPHEALGARLAQETIRLQEPGARIIVFARDPVPFPVPASAAQLDGFLRTLKKAGRSVTAIRGVKLDPLRLAAVPPGDFFDQLRLGRDNDVIVSFLAPPVLDAEQLAKLGNKRPRVLAVCSGATRTPMELRRLFEQRLLAVAVVSRSDPPGRQAAGSRADAFDQMFKLITPANLAELQPLAVARE
jgi:hypothetical protein